MTLCTSVQRLGVCAAMLSFAFVTLGPETDLSPARHAFGQTKVLPANPGLDGGKGGHWGAKNDKHWVDDRWNKTDIGPFLASSLKTPVGVIAKSIAVRLGDKGQAAICFDSEFGTYRCGWLAGFLKFDGKRFGVIEKPSIAGRVQWSGPRGSGWPGGDSVRYRGMYLSGNRVIFSYLVGTTSVLDAPWAQTKGGTTVFTRTVQISVGSKNISMVVAKSDARVTLKNNDDDIAVRKEKGNWVLFLGPRTKPVRATLVISSGRSRSSEYNALVSATPAPTRDLNDLTRAGAPLWKPITTKGVLSKRDDKPYVIDTLTIPFDNPYKALMFLSGIDFFRGGDAAITTVHGDVWLVSGINAGLEKITWKRFATGLFQPLGLRIINDRCYVIGRDQITILYDRNRDGQADYYQCFTQSIKTSPRGHDYVACLEVDKDGNFYYVDPRGLHKVVSTGNQNKTLATGWRNPNGMSLGPDGTITVAPQEGEWTPASMIDEIPPGKKDMYFGSKGPRKSTKRKLGYDPHMVYLPRHIDNSTGSQVWVTSTRWGELEGQLLNLSYGRSEMQLILRDKVGGAYQGAVVPMGLRFSSGAMRGRFHPNDGQLYVVGMKGWATNAVKDGCLQRVRYTKKPFDRPVSWKAYIGGLLITFDQPLNKKLASDTESYAAERWNYEYSEKYGSEEHSVKIPGKVGHDAVEIESATLLADGKSIYLQISNMTKAHVMQIRYDLENTDGAELTGVMFATINKLDLKR